jgi:hypothetical protein
MLSGRKADLLADMQAGSMSIILASHQAILLAVNLSNMLACCLSCRKADLHGAIPA